MSNMTMPLWKVLELQQDPYDIDAPLPPLGSGQRIGLDRYPLFDESERWGINRLIIDHFWNRDIGQETISMFVMMMRRTMREIMPTYNQLYLSSKLILPGQELSTYDLTTIRNGTVQETGNTQSDSSTSANGNAQSQSVFFDTPQVKLAGNKDYATNATEAESNSANTGTSSGKNSSTTNASNNDNSQTTGRQGAIWALLAGYRSQIINTDALLLNDPELTTMFLGIWDTGDEIPQPHRFRARAL